MSSNESDWTWSDEHQKYYRQKYDRTTGQWNTIWDDRPIPRRSDSHGPYPTYPTQPYAEPQMSEPTNNTTSSASYNFLYNRTGGLTNPSYVYGSVQPNHSEWQNSYQQYTGPPQMPSFPSNVAPSAPYQQPYNQLTPNYPLPTPTVSNGPNPREGAPLEGRYGRTSENQREELDESYYVRPRSFFQEGKVFSVLFSEAAGETAPTTYNSTISRTYLGGYVHTQIRRFIVVRARREFCFACPIFTYGGRATNKPGVRADEHAVIYSLGQEATLLHGESGLKPRNICMVDAAGVRHMDSASRIYFGIHHPIQFNLRVKDLGNVHPNSLQDLRGYFMEEYTKGVTMQDIETSVNQNDAKRYKR